MSALKPLLDVALVGTARQPPTPPAVDGPVGELLLQVAQSPAPPAQRLLAMAGVLDLCEHAGYLPAPAGASVPAAAADSAPAADDALARGVLAPLLSEGPERLQHLALRALAATGQRLPPQLLPAALEAGRRSLALRAAIAPVLGRRGLWLAALNPAWKYAAGTDTEAPLQQQWELGSSEQRRAVLAAWRRADPAGARERLAGDLAELGARERADFAALLAPQLTPADEPFVEGLLKDRSKDVRQAAVRLLLRLPEGRHARALAAALAPLVRTETSFLGSKLVIEAPAAADPAWSSGGLDLTRPGNETLGERAWWLYQLVRATPPGWWERHTRMRPADLLKATRKSEWREALVRGWHDAVLATGDSAWVEALLQEWEPKWLGQDPSAMLVLLPLAEREQHWARALDGADAAGVARVLAQALHALPPGQLLSPALSARLAAALATQLAGGDAFHLRHQLTEALCVLDPQSLDTVLAAVRRAGDTPAATESSLRAERIVAARSALAQLPPSSPSAAKPS